MSSVPRKNGSYTVKRGDMVMLEGEKAIALKLLLQGKLNVYITPDQEKLPLSFEELRLKSYRLFELEQNIFLSSNDILRCCNESFSVAASTDCSLFAYYAESPQDAWSVIHSQKDYGAYVMNSICNLIYSSFNSLEKVSSYCSMLEGIFENLGAFYMALAEEFGFEVISEALCARGLSRLGMLKNSNVSIPLHFNKHFIESDVSQPANSFCVTPECKEKITYFTHMYNLPVELRKAFFAADQYITSSHILSASECLEQILLELRRVFRRLEEDIALLYSDHPQCIYNAFLEAAREMHTGGIDTAPAQDVMSYLFDKLGQISAYIESEYGHTISIDFTYFEHCHQNVISTLAVRSADNSIHTSGELNIDINRLPEELINSAAKIVEYSEIADEKATHFMMNLTAFRNLRDKLSNDDSVRNIRSAVAKNFFEIYGAVFSKFVRLKDNSRLIKMFLAYGYMDERLLDTDQVLALFKLAGMENVSGEANVYYMNEWLTKVYEMEKDPSINQFGQDYYDVFREYKKQGKVTDKDKPAYDNDKSGRLAFEVNHMLHTNHRLCQGQLSLYFPILHKGMSPHDPIRSFVTPELIKEKLDKILAVDYSAFHREINYMDPSKGIEKELVMMAVTPDIILMPVYGSRAIMWQEIAGRVRSTPGRFLIPVFTDENLDEMLIKLVGNFRWELCRTMMGAAWNDVTQSSLTSDYTDYIQFYRKNRDLTDEAKEKIKSAVAKYRSKTRDIFTADYELWINNESKGNPRLNKVARAILFKHCTFSKEIRDQLERQPMYFDMINLMKNQKVKLVKSLENRYRHYLKDNNGKLNDVLNKNLEFYRDL